MMTLLKNKFSILLLGVLVSCSESDDNPDQFVAGTIVGSVNLYDESTSAIDKSNMMVSVVGTSPEISVLTNDLGNFSLLNVPHGSYVLEYKKVGYGTFKKVVNHGANGQNTIIDPTPSLGKLSSTEVTDFNVEVNNLVVKIAISTNPPGNTSNRRYVRFFLHSNAGVSSTLYTYFSPIYTSQINPFEKTLTQSELLNLGFTSGQTVFVRAYGDSFWDNAYEDATLNIRIFPNLNATTVASTSFIVP